MDKRFELPCGSYGDVALVASNRDQVALERTFRCLWLVDQDGNISTRELAKRMQVSNGAAYYVLSALIEKGYIKIEKFKNNRNKSEYLYLLTSAGLREKSLLTAKFIQRKREEYHALKIEIEAFERELAK